MELWIFIVAIYLIYILFFKKKKTKSAGSYTSAPVKAPPKEWLANNKKNQSVMQNEDSEDDNLATFTLSGGRKLCASNPQPPASVQPCLPRLPGYSFSCSKH